MRFFPDTMQVLRTHHPRCRDTAQILSDRAKYLRGSQLRIAIECFQKISTSMALAEVLARVEVDCAGKPSIECVRLKRIASNGLKLTIETL